jgi:hypothetical protein
MPLPSYPEYNGNRFSWASIQIRFNGKRYIGVKSLKCSQELEPEMVYGTSAQPIGRTQGDLKPDASLEMYTAEADALIDDLGDGYMEKEFDIHVAFQEGAKISTRVLKKCRLKKVDESHSRGTDALTTTFDLSVMWIERNGKKPLKNMLAGF